MSASVAKLGKMIFSGWFVAAMYTALALIMIAVGLEGGDLGAVLVPWAVGMFLGALLSFGVATRTSSVRRALRVAGRGSWGAAEVGARMKPLNMLWLVGVASTAVVGLLTLVTHGGTGRALAGIGTLMGLVVQVQPRALLWSATRTLNEFAREVAEQAHQGYSFGYGNDQRRY
jgi:hypothetical protein